MSKAAKALVPGRTVRLEHYEATVYPAGARHADRLFVKVVGVLQHAGALVAKPGEDVKVHGERIVSELIPFAITHALDVMSECVVLPKGATLKDVPHFDLPPIAEAWILESFGEEKKWRPWVALVEEVATRLNGGKAIRMSEIWSRASSILASRSATSTSSSSPESRIAG